MRNRIGKMCKALLFTGLCIVFFVLISFQMRPVWKDWNHYDTMYGFYKEPKNTIEVLFLGSSMMINGVSPMQLYEEHGICAYNMATEQQPLMASYYWAQEVYRLHPDTLKLIVLDASMLRRVGDDILFQKAFSTMQCNANKWNFVSDYVGAQAAGNWDELNRQFDRVLPFQLPLMAYHSRWNAFWQSDFDKWTDKPRQYERGFNYVTLRYMDLGNSSSIPVSEQMLEDDEDLPAAELCEASLTYFEKLVTFCRENEIQLMLTKIPTVANWYSAEHEAVAHLAEENQLPFYDLSFSDAQEQLDFHPIWDQQDQHHLNVWGAEKVTRILGEYLAEHYSLTDVRGCDGYYFLDEQLEAFHSMIADGLAINSVTDPVQYIRQAMEGENRLVFVAVSGCFDAQITDLQRAEMDGLGLHAFTKLQDGDSYLAILENNRVLEEIRLTSEGDLERFDADGKYGLKNVYLRDIQEGTGLFLEGLTPEGTPFIAKSGGTTRLRYSSCLIDGSETMSSYEGINIVVYDDAQNRMVNTAHFQTSVESERKTLTEEKYHEMLAKIDQINRMQYGRDAALNAVWKSYGEEYHRIYLYERRSHYEYLKEYTDRNLGQEDFFAFLDLYWKEPGCLIYLCVADDAERRLDYEAKKWLASKGLLKASAMEYGNSYIGIVDEGNVSYEAIGSAAEKLYYVDPQFTFESCGHDCGATALMKVMGVDYLQNYAGFNVLVFDRRLQSVVAAGSFDTGRVTPIVPETSAKEGGNKG